MKTRHAFARPHRDPRGFTLTETLIAVALGSLVMAVLGSLSLYGARSFAAMTNYVDLDNKSRLAVDLLSREIHQATGVVNLTTNLSSKTLTLTNANDGTVFDLAWSSSQKTLVLRKAGAPERTLLTGCEAWNVSLYQRTPIVSATNILCFPAVKPGGAVDSSQAKLIDMSWKCSRTIMGQPINTESIQTAQIVLRNKH